MKYFHQIKQHQHQQLKTLKTKDNFNVLKMYEEYQKFPKTNLKSSTRIHNNLIYTMKQNTFTYATHIYTNI